MVTTKKHVKIKENADDLNKNDLSYTIDNEVKGDVKQIRKMLTSVIDDIKNKSIDNLESKLKILKDREIQ